MSVNLMIRNGVLLDDSELCVDPRAESFAYGYGVFSTLKVRAGKIAYFDHHWERLRAGAEALGLDLPRTKAQTIDDLHRLIAAEQSPDAIAKVCLLLDRDHTDQVVFLRSRLDPRAAIIPIKLGVAPFARFSQSVAVRYKTMNYLENWMALQDARRAGNEDCVFINERGELTEAATSNVFLLSGDRLTTPPVSCGLLPGIIRKRILALASERGLRAEEALCTLQSLHAAEEVFLSSSSGIRPVATFHDGDRSTRYSIDRSQGIRTWLLEDESRHLS